MAGNRGSLDGQRPCRNQVQSSGTHWRRELVAPFQHLGNSRLHFGEGALQILGSLFPPDSRLLVISGGHFLKSSAWKALESAWKSSAVFYQQETVSGEPSPETVDKLVEIGRNSKTNTVIAIGGGSVLDAGKAVAAMMLHQGSVVEYLEGVGTRQPTEKTLPVYAVPTTAGTGSEATKNAVISRRGDNGFKKSLRHNAYIPSMAILDPALAVGCPMDVSIACGLDSFCQLIESLISTGATPYTDMFAYDGISRFARGWKGLLKKGLGHESETEFRAELALAAYASGLTLANAGLGTVHGIAGPLGAYCDVPHGVACGLLLGPVLRKQAAILRERNAGRPLAQLAFAGSLFRNGGAADSRTAMETVSEADDIQRLLDACDSWARTLPRLSSYGLTESTIDAVVDDSGNKNAPAALDRASQRDILVSLL